MRRGITVAVAVISSAGLIALGAGCGGGDAASSTPGEATTIANNAPQTDSDGKTVPAPGASTSASSGGTESAAGGSGGESGGGADAAAAAGKTVFEATCQGCHPSGGTAAGVGPQLSATKMTEAQIKTQVEKGKGAMPGGLVSGTDLDNVVAYVNSIKQ